MKVKLGKMRATIGYACTPGPPCVENGNIVLVWDATNLPDREGNDYFVARVDDPDNSICVAKNEVEVFEGIEGCRTCDSCEKFCDSNLCSDCVIGRRRDVCSASIIRDVLSVQEG
jgi:hypothetical protein